MKIALLTLNSLVSTPAVLTFLSDHPIDVVLVGLSNPHRSNIGGAWGQIRRRIKRSGLTILPYLVANFSLPEMVSTLNLGAVFPRFFYPSISRLCRALGLRIVKVNDVNSTCFWNQLREAKADLIVTFHFDQILSAETIALCARGGLNVHPSLLPHNRGPIPTFYALMEDAPRLGVTIHRLSAEIDAGAILLQEQVLLPRGISATAASYELHQRGRVLLSQVLVEDNFDRGVEPNRMGYKSFPTSRELSTARARGVRLFHLSDLRVLLHTVHPFGRGR